MAEEVAEQKSKEGDSLPQNPAGEGLSTLKIKIFQDMVNLTLGRVLEKLHLPS